MSAIKITPADKWYSLCVRKRANWTCERCGTYAPADAHKRLDCSHFHGRGKWSVRHDPDNGFALCMGCHLYLGSRPIEHVVFAREKLGKYRFDALTEKAADTTRGRQIKRELKQVAAHYRSEFARMGDGEQFAGYL